jgi:hypothetical protein
MDFPRGSLPAWSLLTLYRTRSMLAALRYRVLVGGIALGYALMAMVVGGMVYVPAHPLHTGWFFYVYPSGPGASWTYPAILAGGPTFEIFLPFVSAILMTLSAAGVGLGMALAVRLGARLIRQRTSGLVGPTSVGSVAGLTPAMIAFLTLGACCSTTAAATAGIGLAAQSTGTNTAAVLANAWYLGLFQVVVIYVALLAQEQLLGVYGFLLGPPSEVSVPTRTGNDRPGRLDGRVAARAVLRIALLGAGLTWSLAMLTGWFASPPGRASEWAWFGWVFQHEVPGILAVLVALFPAGVLAFWSSSRRAPSRLAVRGLLLTAGIALLTWMPAPVARAGAVAWGNEVLGLLGGPASWGAVAPPGFGPIDLSLRWAFQFLMLGVLAVALGVAPESTMRVLVPTRVARSGSPMHQALREAAPIPSDGS